MKILMVSSEFVPYVKSGGLADVVTALSSELAEMGHDVKVLLPLYSFVNYENFNMVLNKTDIKTGFDNEEISFLETTYGKSKVGLYFLKSNYFTHQPGIYGKNGSHNYRNNYFRFALLSKSTFTLAEHLQWFPDIIHAHDWPTGLVASYLKEFKKDNKFLKTESIFTIHNTGYQGIFSKYNLHRIGLPWKALHSKEAGFKDQINFLRCGIENSKMVTTVSPSYADEIKKEGSGHGLEKLLVEKGDSFKGILNGVDYSEWNPEKDSLLEYNFSITDLSNKWKLKEVLQKKSGLETDPGKIVIGMVGRLADQKGFAELCGNPDNSSETGALEEICKNKEVQVIILGTGESWIEQKLSEMDNRFSNLKLFLEFDNKLAHLIEAGSDFFLMPSKYEPCGLNQIYSLKYGSIPIVTPTGGLKDTVIDYFTQKEEATGFHIPEMSSASIVQTVYKAVDIFKDSPETIELIRKRGMSEMFTWSEAAAKYERIYKETV